MSWKEDWIKVCEAHFLLSDRQFNEEIKATAGKFAAAGRLRSGAYIGEVYERMQKELRSRSGLISMELAKSLTAAPDLAQEDKSQAERLATDALQKSFTHLLKQVNMDRVIAGVGLKGLNDDAQLTFNALEKILRHNVNSAMGTEKVAREKHKPQGNKITIRGNQNVVVAGNENSSLTLYLDMQQVQKLSTALEGLIRTIEELKRTRRG